MSGSLAPRGDFKNLLTYRKAELIYDLTFYFAHAHLAKNDLTVDQMVQAARSGKQNIAEASTAAVTSAETEIKLTNVAKASLVELRIDYEDFCASANCTSGRKIPRKRSTCATNPAMLPSRQPGTWR